MRYFILNLLGIVASLLIIRMGYQQRSTYFCAGAGVMANGLLAVTNLAYRWKHGKWPW